MSWADARFAAKKEEPVSANAKIAAMRDELEKLVSEWHPNDWVPANYVRETGMDKEIALVDVHVGGYQDAHRPVVIGWRVERGGRLERGIVMVGDPNDPASVQTAIVEAQASADAAYFRMFGDLPPAPFIKKHEPAPVAAVATPQDPFALEGA